MSPAGTLRPDGAAVRALVDGVPSQQVPIEDRGLRYGDGLFETVRIAAGQPVWWELHLARLARGCDALGMECPPRALLDAEIAALCGGADGVLRLLLTRGDGPRGYAPGDAAPRRVLVLAPAPARLQAPLALDWATLALSIQPRLAGLKHLNRLEQVLAAQECSARGLDELLLCDQDGAVASAISANLFVVRAGALLTPLLDRCGVAGTCRAWLLAGHAEARVVRLARTDVEDADELFLCNSVRGILPVGRLGDRVLATGPATRALMRRLASEHPSLATDMRIDG